MATTNFVWDVENDSYLLETDESGQAVAEYTNVPVEYGELVSQHRSGGTSFYHCDSLGSMRALTDDAANVTDTATYAAFGEEVAKAGPTVNAFEYVGALGYYADPETLNLYVRARVYHTTLGRWASADPLGVAGGVNFHRYANNNPIGYVDPGGLAPVRVPCNGRATRICQTQCARHGGLNRCECWQDTTPGWWIFPPTVHIFIYPYCKNHGDCYYAEHRYLQGRVNLLCKRPRRCRGGEPPEELGAKLRLNLDCAAARDVINNQCYKGGDKGHRDAADQARKAAERCQRLLNGGLQALWA